MKYSAALAILIAAGLFVDPAAAQTSATPPASGQAQSSGQSQGSGQAQGAGQEQGRGRGQGRGGGFNLPQPQPFESHEGFQQIFDGTTMKNWDGDPRLWKVEDGALVGQSSAENKVTENTFLIYRGGEPKDFELKLEYRINATNSGIQIRSQYLPEGTASGRGNVSHKWVLKGYQADIDFENRFTGQIYEERGRGFLAMRGQFSYVPNGGGPKVLGALQNTDDELKGIIKANDWNQVHIIARGNLITEILNGHVTSVLLDDDTKNRAMSGLLGFQMHVGDPMKVEFKNIWLKEY